MSERKQDEGMRSRRAILSGAIGVAAGAAVALAAPAAALAHDADDVALNVDNASTATTSITQGTADTAAFQANGQGDGAGVVGTTDGTLTAGVVGLAGDPTGSFYDSASDLDSGVYGFAGQSAISSGLFGEGPTGVYGYGDYGVYADGATVGVFASAYPSGTAIHAHAGDGPPPITTTNVALYGTVTTSTQAGIYAKGRVIFPNRSGRIAFSAGQSAKSVTVTGMTSANYAFGTVQKSVSGLYVRAVVPAAGKITIYLSKAVTSTTYVAWLVLG
jgi:hypothetical protein